MPAPRVVLDTNVVVSAHLNAGGWEAFVFDLAVARKLQWYVSPEILVEYQDVLSRKKFRLTPALVEQSLDLIRQSSLLVRPSVEFHITADESDNKFLECAHEAKADFLVSGNKRHYPKSFANTKILNAKELLQMLISNLSL